MSAYGRKQTPREGAAHCILCDLLHSFMCAKASCFVGTPAYLPLLREEPLMYYSVAKRLANLKD